MPVNAMNRRQLHRATGHDSSTAPVSLRNGQSGSSRTRSMRVKVAQYQRTSLRAGRTSRSGCRFGNGLARQKRPDSIGFCPSSASENEHMAARLAAKSPPLRTRESCCKLAECRIGPLAFFWARLHLLTYTSNSRDMKVHGDARDAALSGIG